MENKDQHIISRSYLKLFVDPNTPQNYEPYVWVHERGESEAYRKAPRKTSIRSYYYSVPTETGYDHSVDKKLLFESEQVGIPIIKRLAGGLEPSELDDKERNNLSFFLAAMSLRVPMWRDSVEKSRRREKQIKLMLTVTDPLIFEERVLAAIEAGVLDENINVEELRQSVLSGEYDDIPLDPIDSLRAMVDAIERVIDHIYHRNLRVLFAPPNSMFVTSDVPLAQIATSELPPYLSVGWETQEMEATFPITPSTCLLISAHHPEGREEISADKVVEVNWRTAWYAKTVYGSRQFSSEELNRPPNYKWRPLTQALTPEFQYLSERFKLL